MHDTLTAVTRPYGADSPLAHLLDMVQAVGQPTADEQREDAVTTAAHYVYKAYPDTLGRVLEAMDWTGYPALHCHGFSFEPAATAWLDGGLWLHHTLRLSENGAFDVLTLIVPCTCGAGYSDIVLDSEDMLIEILAELRPTHGRSVHDESLGDCRSVRSLAPLGRPLAAL
ncbi:hypothetical protein ACIQJT_40935 [Streptomyces sp. NPDC091972]|uniref:hypothetical protein n=1 Tax=Streptomyces sp. NPDC091972 TaxID=3366007 RepID=UPI00381F51E7